MKYKAISDVGCVRQNNEDIILVDSLYVRDETAEGQCNICAIVADGMGGADGGELASDIACQEFESWLASLPTGLDQYEIKAEINRFTQSTHAFINLRGNELEGFKGMGTTLVGVFHYGGRWWWLNIGDSRLYLYRGGDLMQISTDHSMRNFTGDTSQPANLIYNCLGNGDDFEAFADFGPLDLMTDDRILLCSDGLTDMVDDDEIKSDFDIEKLVANAKHAGGEDNISIIILIYHE